MTLTPLLQADPAIQIHALAAILAVPVGGFVLWRPKGTALHKALGRLWVMLMLVAATSALFIHGFKWFGPFGPIHIFSVITYVSLFNGLRAIIVKRDIRRHRIEMQALYVNALLLAGAFTFLPGRRMHEVVFGPDAGMTESLVAIALILGVAGLLTWQMRRPKPLSLPSPR